MNQENGITGTQKIKPEFVTIAICTALSVFFMNSGFLTFLYLVPVGYAVIVSLRPWLTFFAVAMANIIGSLVLRQNASGNLLMEMFYFTTLFLMFIWIMSTRGVNTVTVNIQKHDEDNHEPFDSSIDKSNDESKSVITLANMEDLINIRTVYRFIIGSVAGAVAFLIYINSRNSNFYELMEVMAKAIFESLSVSSAGNLTRIMEPENIAETIKNFLFRGGALFTVFFLFFINRQVTLAVTRIARKKQENGKGLMDFFVPVNTIWTFLGALVSILLTRFIVFEIFEILAWNVFIVCSILFLAQGAGIFMYMLSKRTNTFRLVISVLVIAVIFSPVGIFAVTALLLLGITECWRPIRRTVSAPRE